MDVIVNLTFDELVYLLSIVGTDQILRPSRSADEVGCRVHRKLSLLEDRIEIRIESPKKELVA